MSKSIDNNKFEHFGIEAAAVVAAQKQHRHNSRTEDNTTHRSRDALQIWKQCTDRRQCTQFRLEWKPKEMKNNFFFLQFILIRRTANTQWKRVCSVQTQKHEEKIMRQQSSERQSEQDGWRKDANVKILKSIQCRRSGCILCLLGSRSGLLWTRRLFGNALFYRSFLSTRFLAFFFTSSLLLTFQLILR